MKKPNWQDNSDKEDGGMNELIKIGPNGRTTAKELYEFLGLNPTNFSRWCKTNIEDNEFAEEGSDWLRLVVKEETPTGGSIDRQDFELSIAFAKKLCMLSKSERGNQAREYFLEVERRYQSGDKLPAMTPAQLIAAIAQQAADQERAIMALSDRAGIMERRLELVKDTMGRRDDNRWRESISIDISRIVKARGGDFQTVRTESYQLLEERGRCDLSARLRNMKTRMEETGATKTKINGLCKIDVVEQDPKLKEIYTAIVKEMTIKYVA